MSKAGRLAATLALSVLPLVAGAVPALAAPATAAEGYVAPPYWAAYTRDGIAVLTYARVPSAELGNAGGPKGTKTQVPVGVRLVSKGGRTLRSLIAVPKGEAVLAVSASEDGVVVTAGPVKDLNGTTSAREEPWQVIASDLSGAAVAYRYTPRSTLEAPPALASTGGHWAAVTTAAPAHGTVDRSLLLEGRFAQPSRASAFTVAATVLPTQVAVEPSGSVGLFGLEYTAKVAKPPKFPAAAHVALVWPNQGLLVSAPGGFLTVQGNAVARPQSGGRSVLFGRLPKGSGVVSVAGDGQGMVVVVASRKGKLSTWVIGAAPKSLDSVVRSAPSALFMTTAGVVGVAVHTTKHGVTVEYAAAAGS